MTATHKQNNDRSALHHEDKSDMRGIKPGWYAIEGDGNVSCGPFSSLEECVARIPQPTNGTEAS
jgi:hypothetical protein